MRAPLLGISVSLLLVASAAAQDMPPPPAAPNTTTTPPVAPAAPVVSGPIASFETSLGSFTIQLDETHAPVTVKNFVRYAKEKHFDGMAFYRVMSGALIQGGSYDAKGNFAGGLHKPISLEANNGLKNIRGSIAMARTDPSTATAEFFIDVAALPSLDHDPADAANTTGYAVFGQVTSGMDVVDAISKTQTGGTGPFGPNETPVAPVTITHVTISGS